jgi:hypothetical protein
VDFVEVRSLAGSECRLQNPWGEPKVTLFRDGRKAEDVSGALLKFSTRRGERIVVVLPGTTPGQFKRAVPAR